MTGYIVHVPAEGMPYLAEHGQEYDTVDYKRIQEGVEGYIDAAGDRILHTPDGKQFWVTTWVNDEGLLLRLTPNPAATFFTGRHHALVGDALITGTEGPESVTLSKLEAETVIQELLLGVST